jgi:hypothetical protein
MSVGNKTGMGDDPQLWESLHARLHASPDQSPPMPPSIFNGWPPFEELVARSDSIDITDVGAVPVTIEEDVSSTDEREYGEKHRSDTAQAIAESGIEAVAYYAPIHFAGPEYWGIYINEPRFFGMCSEIADRLPGAEYDTIVIDVLGTLENHEEFHAQVELFALVAEDFSNLGHAEVKLDLQNWPAGLPKWPEPPCPHRIYMETEYQSTFPGEHCIEEQLATAIQFSRRFRTKRFHAALASLVENCPPAYAGWARYRDPQSRAEGVQKLAQRIVSRAFPHSTAFLDGFLGRPTDNWFPNSRRGAREDYGTVPWRIYRPHQLRPTRFAQLLVANLRLGDFVKAMERQFGATVRRGGKHQALIFANGSKIPFPTTRTVRPYLINQVARALNVSQRDILSACGLSV